MTPTDRLEADRLAGFIDLDAIACIVAVLAPTRL